MVDFTWHQPPAVSADTLFHFTSSLENLASILVHRFRAHYCVEDLNPVVPDVGIEIEPSDFLMPAIPMVCFCDTPLSGLRRHLRTYGPYGIGMSKAWGLSRSVTPVLYAHPKSAILGALFRAAARVLIRQRDTDGSSRDYREHVEDALDQVLNFTKPYEGRLWREGEWGDTIRFYDEREWRAVFWSLEPESLTREEWEDSSILSSFQEKAWQSGRLDFEPRDVRYLIVAEEGDIPRLIDHIDSAWPHTSLRERQMLATRVVSLNELYRDL